jgi:hypothetical protein
MRAARVLTSVGILAGSMLIVDCSKQGSSPTAPPPSDPSCSLSATSLNFGTVTVGNSADRQVTLTNSGSGTLSGTMSPDTSSFFAVVGVATYSLTAGQSATFTIRFTPVGSGSAGCTLKTGSSKCATIACTATGQWATPICAVTPTGLSFGSVPIGSSAERSFDLANNGGGTLAGSVTGAVPDFTVLNPDFSLTAGVHGPIRIQFNPSSTAAEPCTLSVGSAGCSPVVLNGAGYLQTHDYCSVGVTSGLVDFGEVSVGHTAERTVTLKNFSTAYLARGGVSEYGADFNSLIGSYTIGPGTTITGRVQFTPSRVGRQSCTMPIDCWMDGSGTNPGVQSAIQCTGVGVGGMPVCQLSTTDLDFGSVVVGETKDLPLVVTNTGTGPLSGTAGPSHCPEFAFVGETAYSLGPGQSTTLTLRYIPAQAGHTTTCSLMPIGPDCQPVSAVGAAVGPPTCELSTNSLDFGNVPVGQSKDLTFDIRNAGGGELCGTVTEISPELSIVENASYCITAPAFVRVTVRYTPSAVGSIFADVNAGGGCPRLTARGVGI